MVTHHDKLNTTLPCHPHNRFTYFSCTQKPPGSLKSNLFRCLPRIHSCQHQMQTL